MKERTWLPVSDTDLGGNERKYLLEAFDSGWLSGSGLFVQRFEHDFAAYCGSRYGLTCANGTVAIHLALLALGVGPGDEVIVPSLTYIATANAVTYCGATPVFADCHANTWNVTSDTIRPLLSDRTKGIIVVHLYGNPVDMDPIISFANEHGLFVVEDSAEAHGAEYKGRRTGTFGDISTFSFYGNKIMTTGEGGMVLTNDDVLMQKMRLLRGQGMDPAQRYWFPLVGYNYRLTNLQSALGVAQLERLPEFLNTRRKLADRYANAFTGISGITLQAEQAGGKSSWWMFSIRVANHDTRAQVISVLDQAGIETRPLFWPMHMLPPYKNGQAACPNSEAIAHSSLNLPSGGHVTDYDVERIVSLVQKTLKDMQ